MLRVLLALVLALIPWCLLASADGTAASGKWVRLFNGKDLDGWTVKIAKHPLGDNFADTFRVEDGILKVAYDKYRRFDEQFGHLYSNSAYSRYLLRLEYLLTGHPQLDPTDPDAQRLLEAGASPRLAFGHLALQAEGHGVWFRNIMLRPLDQ